MLKQILLVLLAALPLHAQQPHPTTGVENARLVETLPLDGTLYHVQGVDLDKHHIWVTSVDGNSHEAWLTQFNRATGKQERIVELTDGPRFHPGGFSLYKNSIWVPVAEYKAHSSAVLIELDKRTLAIKRKIPVADHIGCLAVTRNTLVAGNWDSRQLYVFDMQGKQLRVLDTPPETSYQDMKFSNGFLVGSSSPSQTVGSVDWYEWPSMKPARSLKVGQTDRGRIFTGEGLAIQGNNLYLLPEDGPHSRLFHFVITAP